MNQAFNMEQLNFTQQSLSDTVVMVGAMKSASSTLKTQFKGIDIDSIEV
jgi:hypothetical protein